MSFSLRRLGFPVTTIYLLFSSLNCAHDRGGTTHKEACLSKHGPSTDQGVDARLDGHRDLILSDFGQLAAPEAVVEAFLHVTRHQRTVVGLRSVTYMYTWHVHVRTYT